MSKVPQCGGNAGISDSDDQFACKRRLDAQQEVPNQTVRDHARDEKCRRKAQSLEHKESKAGGC